jgi:penicillin-binding protein 1A
MPSVHAQRGRLAWVLGMSALILLISGLLALWLTVRYFQQDLPPVEQIRTVELGEPMRVLTADGQLMAEYGTERRSAVRYDEIPRRVIEAFIAAEDERFMRHHGVDPFGLLRASIRLLQTGERAQGGSTITMQLARNVFLSNERTYTRKIREILLAIQIEEELSKEEILELYLNKIFLGERAYGVAAAAQTYFSRPLSELTLDQAALIAGLPKAPSRDNPIASPNRSMERRNYVLRRMHAAGFIDRNTLAAAQSAPLGVSPYRTLVDVEAPYAAEMARQTVIAALGETAYSQGLRVYTSIVGAEQTAAVNAVRNGLLDVEQRQGWRGVEKQLTAETLNNREALLLALTELPRWPALTTAVITGTTDGALEALTADAETLRLDAAAVEWAGAQRDLLKPGAVIHLRQNSAGELRLSQTPQPQAAFIGLEPQTGAITSMVGGYDFYLSSFNRAVQAQRQIGSAFKPFLYAASFDVGFTPASVVLDAPVVFDDARLEEAWRPTNYSGKFYGPTRLRDALVHSRNLVTVRLLQSIGFEQARSFAQRFGLDRQRLPRDLTMALGSAVYTPLELARAYAVLANGGLSVDPQLIDRVEAADGTVIWRPNQPLENAEGTFAPSLPIVEGTPPPVAEEASDETIRLPVVDDPRRVVPEAVAWLITDILRDAARRGTAARVGTALKRRDLAGKTGTTNDETDAWFAGYNSHRVGVAWVGHDQPQRIGRGEVGGRAALPIWVDVMRVALKDIPDEPSPPPDSVMSVRVDRDTGDRAGVGSSDSIFEFVPVASARRAAETGDEGRPQPTQRPRQGPALDDLF